MGNEEVANGIIILRPLWWHGVYDVAWIMFATYIK